MAYRLQATTEDILIAEGTVVVGDVELHKGTSVWYNAVVRGDEGTISVGENTNIQDCAVVHEASAIGSGCTIGDNTLVGMGAVILTGAVEGRGCIIGAGALVTGKSVVPDGHLALGCPARVVGPLAEAELHGNRVSMKQYLDFSRKYRAGKP